MAESRGLIVFIGLFALSLSACSPATQSGTRSLEAANAQDAAAQAAEEADDEAPLAYASSEEGEDVDPGRARINRLISHYAAVYDVPESLVHHTVNRESTYNPAARNKNNWGLMQIKPQTARTMGYTGTPSGLLDAETNLKYAVKYLRGAYLVAEGDPGRADWYYRTGYYYRAKNMGLLQETGLRP